MKSRLDFAAVSARRPLDAAWHVVGFGTPLLSIVGIAGAQTELNFYDVERYPMALAVSDVNADAAPDILAPCRDSSNDVSLLLNQGNGHFDPAISLYSGTSPRAVTTGDFNRDGWMDYVICNQDQHITVFLNLQDGTFARTQIPVEAPPPYQGHQPRFVKTGDLDNDGDLDLIIPVSTQDYYENWWGLTTFSNDGHGGFTQNNLQIIEGLNTVRGFDVGDLDGDGDLDAVMGVFDYHPCQIPYCYEYTAEGQTLAVFINEGAGQPLTVNYLALNSMNVFVAVSDVALVDLDGDGDRDVVTRVASFGDTVDVMSASETNIQTFMNLGSAAFEPARTIWSQFDAYGHGLAARDIEGDGDIDLIVGAAFGFSRPARLFALLNSGDGLTFSQQVASLGVHRLPLAFAMTDVSGDGQNDFLASFSNPSTVMSLINSAPFAGATLAVSESLVRGQPARVDITNAPFYKPLYLLYSFDDPAPSVGLPNFGGLTLDIPKSSMQILATGMTGMHGTAHFDFNVPNVAPLRNITIQAVIKNGNNGNQSVKTNYQTRRIQQ